MTSDGSSNAPSPAWLQGRGVGPELKWSAGTDGALTSLALCRESGHVIVADEVGTLSQLDRFGKISAMTRLPHAAHVVAWSEDGAWGAALVGDSDVVRFNRELQIEWTLSLSDVGIGLAISPFGHHMAVSLANGRNLILNERKRRIAQFESVRPLTHLAFVSTEPRLIAAADHGLLCSYDLNGARLWQEKLWSNTGGLRITGDGDVVYLAGYAHGVDTYDGDGANVGAYIVEGSVRRIATSYEPNRILAATIEQTLYWLDADGQMLWATSVPDDVVDLACDPLGEWAICGFANAGVFRLDWGGL